MNEMNTALTITVPDPDIFGPPGSGSIICTGPDHFHQKAKKMRRTLKNPDFYRFE
jgi:hypothetical protein